MDFELGKIYVFNEKPFDLKFEVVKNNSYDGYIQAIILTNNGHFFGEVGELTRIGKVGIISDKSVNYEDYVLNKKLECLNEPEV